MCLPGFEAGPSSPQRRHYTDYKLRLPVLSTVNYTAAVSFHVLSHGLVTLAASPSDRFPPTVGKSNTIICLLGSCAKYWHIICHNSCGSTASDAAQCEQREAPLNSKQKLQQSLLKYPANRTKCFVYSTKRVKQRKMTHEWV